ncbi:MAG TPA: hypothetical protein VFI95_19865 [Terriglobales bacterium]|nr:hypothetical protein [Terriglobales bacterium]
MFLRKVVGTLSRWRRGSSPQEVSQEENQLIKRLRELMEMTPVPVHEPSTESAGGKSELA